MNKNERISAAQECFEANKHLKSVHVTSDGQCFSSENLAFEHQRSIKGSRTLTKEEEPLFVEREEEAASASTGSNTDLTKAQISEKLVALGVEVPEKATKPQLLALLEEAEAAQ